MFCTNARRLLRRYWTRQRTMRSARVDLEHALERVGLRGV
jgi:hypothetical protein